MKTRVLPASLTSTAEIMELAGVHHITIAPALLLQLATTPASSRTAKSLFDQTENATNVWKGSPFVDDEAGYRIAFTRSGSGEGERKLSQVRYWPSHFRTLYSVDCGIRYNGPMLTN